MDLLDALRAETDGAGRLANFRLVQHKTGQGYVLAILDDGVIQLHIVREYGNYFVDFAPTASPSERVTTDVLLRVLPHKIDPAPIGRDLSQLIDWIEALFASDGAFLRHLFSHDALPQTRIRLQTAARRSVRERFGAELD